MKWLLACTGLASASEQRSRCSHLHTTGLAGDGEEELELGWELVLGVEAIGEINSANTAVSVDLNSRTKENLRSVTDSKKGCGGCELT